MKFLVNEGHASPYILLRDRFGRIGLNDSEVIIDWSDSDDDDNDDGNTSILSLFTSNNNNGYDEIDYDDDDDDDG